MHVVTDVIDFAIYGHSCIIGRGFQTVHNERSLSVLALLPSLHLVPRTINRVSLMRLHDNPQPSCNP